MATTQLQLLRSVDCFVDACRRFFFVAKRWDEPFMAVPMDGVDWQTTNKLERGEIQVALRAIESAVSRLAQVIDAMDATFPDQWRIVIRSAANLGKHACAGAHKEGWFDDRFGSLSKWYITSELRKAVGWLSFLSDVMTVQGLSHVEREVLEAILQNGPTKGDDLAHLTKWADAQDSTFRKILSEMVDHGLLVSGSGRYSTGYRLSEGGLRLAQLSAQLTDF